MKKKPNEREDRRAMKSKIIRKEGLKKLDNDERKRK